MTRLLNRPGFLILALSRNIVDLQRTSLFYPLTASQPVLVGINTVVLRFG